MMTGGGREAFPSHWPVGHQLPFRDVLARLVPERRRVSPGFEAG